MGPVITGPGRAQEAEWNHGVEWSGMDFSGGCILVILGHFDTFWKIWSEFGRF